jgi:hypothetical protein
LSTQAFDYRDPVVLRDLLATHRTDGGVADFLSCVGIEVSKSTIGNLRRDYRIPIASEAYRRRSDSVKRQQVGHAIAPPVEEQGPDTAALLLDWLESRTVPAPLPPTAAANPADYATCLVASDLHFPHQHEGAFEVFLGLAERIRPTEIVIDGDAFDFSQIGRYVRNPAHYVPIQTDIDLCRERVINRITTAAPDSVRRFIVGNHEEGRWNNYLFTRCPELASLRCLTMEAVLGLTELGWVYQPYEYWVTDQLIIYHGDRHSSNLGGGSAMSARKEAIDMGCSGLTGHTHHAGAFYRRDRMGYRVWHEIGCLCDFRKMQAAGVTAKKTPTKTEDWALCCALVHYRPGHSAFRVQLIPILEDKGRVFAIYEDAEIAVRTTCYDH